MACLAVQTKMSVTGSNFLRPKSNNLYVIRNSIR